MFLKHTQNFIKIIRIVFEIVEKEKKIFSSTLTSCVTLNHLLKSCRIFKDYPIYTTVLQTLNNKNANIFQIQKAMEH